MHLHSRSVLNPAKYGQEPKEKKDTVARHRGEWTPPASPIDVVRACHQDARLVHHRLQTQAGNIPCMRVTRSVAF